MKSEQSLPSDWRWVKLGEVCEKPQYGYTARAETRQIGPKLLRITDIQKGSVNWEEVPYCVCENEISRYSLNPGDILIARTGGTTGKSYIINELPSQAVFASYLIRVRTGRALVPDYLYLFLQSDLYWNQVYATKRGGAQPNMNASLISNILLPLPPVSQQRRIAAKIEELMQDVDRARVACEKQLKASKALLAAYLREVFESDEAKKWERKKLREVCEVVTGSTPRTDDLTNWDGDILWATPNDMGKLSGFTISNTERRISEKGLQSCSAKLLPVGSVLLTTRAPIGHVAINLKPMCTNQGFKSLVPFSQIHSWFLFFAIKYFVPALRTMGRGQTFTEISKRQVQDFIIPLSSLSEQRRIAAKIQEIMQDVGHARAACEKQLKTIISLPEIVLKKAFRGEI